MGFTHNCNLLFLEGGTVGSLIFVGVSVGAVMLEGVDKVVLVNFTLEFTLPLMLEFTLGHTLEFTLGLTLEFTLEHTLEFRLGPTVEAFWPRAV